MDDLQTADDFERSMARRKFRNYAILGGIGVIAAGIIGYRMYGDYARVEHERERNAEYARRTDEARRKGANTWPERADLGAKLGQLAAETDQRDAAYKTALDDAFASLHHGTQECPTSEKLRKFSVRKDANATAYSTHMREAISAGREELEQGYFPSVLKSHGDVYLFRYELVLDESLHREAEIVGERFKGGVVMGRALVWDSAKQQVVCFAENVAAASSDQISYTTSVSRELWTQALVHNTELTGSSDEIQAALKNDLHEQTTLAILESLRAEP